MQEAKKPKSRLERKTHVGAAALPTAAPWPAGERARPVTAAMRLQVGPPSLYFHRQFVHPRGGGGEVVGWLAPHSCTTRFGARASGRGSYLWKEGTGGGIQPVSTNAGSSERGRKGASERVSHRTTAAIKTTHSPPSSSPPPPPCDCCDSLCRCCRCCSRIALRRGRGEEKWEK